MMRCIYVYIYISFAAVNLTFEAIHRLGFETFLLVGTSKTFHDQAVALSVLVDGTLTELLHR